jgi:glycosyltransferase involved in cell wall biosynthesis
MPKVSVVVPVYNGERFLQEALDSVLAQTYQDYEVICVDDGSTDGSLDVFKKYSGRVSVIRQPNSGQGAARNAGVGRASGAYVAFLDQDDRWYPHKLDRQVAVLEADPDIVLVLCNSDRMDVDGRILQRGATLADRATLLESPLGRLMEEDLILPSAILVRRDVFERAGMYDSELRGFEDFDLCARLKQHGPFKFLEEAGMCYRVHAGGFNQVGKDAIVHSRERFLLRMRELYAADQTKQALIRIMLAECYSDWGLNEVRAGKRRHGRRMLLYSLRHDPIKFRTYSRLLRSFLPGISPNRD